MNKLSLSVIIPVYNQSKYILNAIDSVFSQTIQPLEIIIIDDGSDENIEDLLKQSQPTIRYVRQSHLGAGAARNKGVELSTGEWIAFLDADDLWKPEKIAAQWNIAKEKDINIVFSHIQQFISPELLRGKLAETTLKNEVLPGHCASTLMIKKDTFHQIGLFNVNYKLGEFIAWYMAMQKSGLSYHLLDEILALRRIHQNNSSTRNKLSRHDYLHLLHEAKKND